MNCLIRVFNYLIIRYTHTHTHTHTHTIYIECSIFTEYFTETIFKKVSIIIKTLIVGIAIKTDKKILYL